MFEVDEMMQLIESEFLAVSGGQGSGVDSTRALKEASAHRKNELFAGFAAGYWGS